MSKEKKEITMPSVLSFEKKLVPSDGFMYGLVWEDRKNDQKRAQPLEIIEKSGIKDPIWPLLDSVRLIKTPYK